MEKELLEISTPQVLESQPNQIFQETIHKLTERIETLQTKVIE